MSTIACWRCDNPYQFAGNACRNCDATDAEGPVSRLEFDSLSGEKPGTAGKPTTADSVEIGALAARQRGVKSLPRPDSIEVGALAERQEGVTGVPKADPIVAERQRGVGSGRLSKHAQELLNAANDGERGLNVVLIYWVVPYVVLIVAVLFMNLDGWIKVGAVLGSTAAILFFVGVTRVIRPYLVYLKFRAEESRRANDN